MAATAFLYRRSMLTWSFLGTRPLLAHAASISFTRLRLAKKVAKSLSARVSSSKHSCSRAVRLSRNSRSASLRWAWRLANTPSQAALKASHSFCSASRLDSTVGDHSACNRFTSSMVLRCSSWLARAAACSTSFWRRWKSRVRSPLSRSSSTATAARYRFTRGMGTMGRASSSGFWVNRAHKLPTSRRVLSSSRQLGLLQSVVPLRASSCSHSSVHLAVLSSRNRAKFSK